MGGDCRKHRLDEILAAPAQDMTEEIMDESDIVGVM
jgi:hypothetical protein